MRGSPTNMTTHADVELPGGIDARELRGGPDAGSACVCRPRLQREFGGRREQLLGGSRAKRRARLSRRGDVRLPPTSTREVRESDWQVEPVPQDMQQRWVEITGPTDRKLVINALNSGADGFMADFEDADAPTWRNMVEGHINLRDAIDGTITLPRPRTGATTGWSTTWRRCSCAPAGGIFPSATCWSTARRCRVAVRLRAVLLSLRRSPAGHGVGPYFYLPKLESHLEARLWNDVFCFAQDELGVPRGHDQGDGADRDAAGSFRDGRDPLGLRHHSAGLNAGRWDYIFSSIKCFPDRPEMVLPDRGDVTMTVPFMRAYAELLAATCHRRGAHAMGGMAALIPSRKDEEANEKALAGVRADKEREVGQGYDGTWVAHPDLVSTAREVFENGLQGAPNQLERQPESTRHLAAAARPGGHAREYHRGWTAHRRQRRLSVRLVLAERPRRGGDQLADGGRRHRRDLAVADLAVGPPRRRSSTTGARSPPSSSARCSTRRPPKIREAVGEETWQAGRPAETARSSRRPRCHPSWSSS